jgi:hypothetical protein
MPEDNILVAVHRDDAAKLLLDCGWGYSEELGGWYHRDTGSYGWSLSGALHIALADEAKQLCQRGRI